jgi:hypothetical protein
LFIKLEVTDDKKILSHLTTPGSEYESASEILDSHSGAAENAIILTRDAVSLGVPQCVGHVTSRSLTALSRYKNSQAGGDNS